MRAVLSISIPPEKLAALKKKAQLANMTISAYILQRVDEEEHLINEDELLFYAKEARKDFLSGKTKKLLNPQDLLLPELP